MVSVKIQKMTMNLIHFTQWSETGEIELDFDFSYYEQVYSVRIDDAECDIDPFIRTKFPICVTP